MNQISQNGLNSATALEEKQTTPAPLEPASVASSPADNRPYVPEKDKRETSLRERAGVLLGGAVILIAILLLAFGRFLHPPASTAKTSIFQAKKTTQPAESTESKVPLTDEGHSTGQPEEQAKLGPKEIAGTATQHPGQLAANLGAIQPFDNQGAWQPGTYQPSAQNADSTQIDHDGIESKSDRDAMDKASLVFVRSSQSSAVQRAPANIPFDLGIGLPPGTRLRARIETAASTAVETPVIAVIEYNYEKNGEIIVPAGAKAFGHLEAADRTGYVGVRFDSLLMPDGTSVGIDAAATDLQFRPLKGRVEGKHTGRNILVRSFAGLGEITATLGGRGSLTQPLSEGDLLRASAANNIAQASDEQVARLAVTERIVVTVPANTDIYVVLGKASRTVDQPDSRSSPTRAVSSSSADQLRQLLQLQRELNQQSYSSNSNQ